MAEKKISAAAFVFGGGANEFFARVLMNKLGLTKATKEAALALTVISEQPTELLDIISQAKYVKFVSQLQQPPTYEWGRLKAYRTKAGQLYVEVPSELREKQNQLFAKIGAKESVFKQEVAKILPRVSVPYRLMDYYMSFGSDLLFEKLREQKPSQFATTAREYIRQALQGLEGITVRPRMVTTVEAAFGGMQQVLGYEWMQYYRQLGQKGTQEQLQKITATDLNVTKLLEIIRGATETERGYFRWIAKALMLGTQFEHREVGQALMQLLTTTSPSLQEKAATRYLQLIQSGDVKVADALAIQRFIDVFGKHIDELPTTFADFLGKFGSYASKIAHVDYKTAIHTAYLEWKYGLKIGYLDILSESLKKGIELDKEVISRAALRIANSFAIFQPQQLSKLQSTIQQRFGIALSPEEQRGLWVLWAARYGNTALIATHSKKVSKMLSELGRAVQETQSFADLVRSTIRDALKRSDLGAFKSILSVHERALSTLQTFNQRTSKEILLEVFQKIEEVLPSRLARAKSAAEHARIVQETFEAEFLRAGLGAVLTKFRHRDPNWSDINKNILNEAVAGLLNEESMVAVARMNIDELQTSTLREFIERSYNTILANEIIKNRTLSETLQHFTANSEVAFESKLTLANIVEREGHEKLFHFGYNLSDIKAAAARRSFTEQMHHTTASTQAAVEARTTLQQTVVEDISKTVGGSDSKQKIAAAIAEQAQEQVETTVEASKAMASAAGATKATTEAAEAIETAAKGAAAAGEVTEPQHMSRQFLDDVINWLKDSNYRNLKIAGVFGGAAVGLAIIGALVRKNHEKSLQEYRSRVYHILQQAPQGFGTPFTNNPILLNANVYTNAELNEQTAYSGGATYLGIPQGSYTLRRSV